jgi:hypothetical protein
MLRWPGCSHTVNAGRIPTERHVLRLHLFPWARACNHKAKQNLLLNICSVVFELADIPNCAKNNKITDAGNQFGNIFQQPLARQPALWHFPPPIASMHMAALAQVTFHSIWPRMRDGPGHNRRKSNAQATQHTKYYKAIRQNKITRISQFGGMAQLLGLRARRFCMRAESVALKPKWPGLFCVMPGRAEASETGRVENAPIASHCAGCPSNFKLWCICPDFGRRRNV